MTAFRDQTDEVLAAAVERSQSVDMPVCSNCGNAIGDPDCEYWYEGDLYCQACMTGCANCAARVPKGEEQISGWYWSDDDGYFYCQKCAGGCDE